MENERFELFFETLYSMLGLIRKHLLVGQEEGESGNVTKAHFPLLLVVHSRGSVTMGGAARTVGLSKPHMTMQVDKLVEEGLMERLYDPGDRRLVTVRLTEKGTAFVVALKDRMRQKAWRLFSTISDEELEKTLQALLTLKDVMARAEHENGGKEKKGG
jgi:DNA-binding MarR family transcriptional regulator